MKKYFLIALVLSGCVSLPPKPEERQLEQRVTFLYQSARHGIIEPCGCQTSPYGGIDREANAVQTVRHDVRTVFYADGGNTLAPKKLAADLTHHKEKAEHIIGMLNLMGLDVFAPGPTDYALSLAFLKEAEKKSEFPYIATNVVGKNDEVLFPPIAIVEKEGVRAAFLSASPTIAGDSVKTITPEEAIKKHLDDAKGQSDIIVLLSQLDFKTNEKLARKFPEIKLIISGDPSVAYENAILVDKTTLLADSLDYGYRLGRADFELKLPFKGLYSPKSIFDRNRELALWNERKSKGKRVDSKRIEILENEQLSPIPDGTSYSHMLIKLSQKEFGKSNAISKLKQEYQESLRKKAITD